MPISWSDFEQVNLRVGTIQRAEPFPEARKPMYKLRVDFGGEIGVKQSAAQITDRYDPSDLEGRQVLAVTNLPPKEIGPFTSEVLVTGFVLSNDEVVLVGPDEKVPNGLKLQ